MSEPGQCPLCRGKAEFGGNASVRRVECAVCGTYEVVQVIARRLDPGGDLSLFSRDRKLLERPRGRPNK